MEIWETPFHQFVDRPEAILVPKGSVLSMHPSAITETVLSRCTATELAAIAMSLGVPRTGTRSKLSAKILATIELRLTLASATHEELQKLPGKELRSLLKRAGAYVPQNKYGMASALIGWREECRLEGRASIAKAIHYLHVSAR